MTHKPANGDNLVNSDLVGEAWPPVAPGSDPVLYGHVSLTPKNPVEVRSTQTFTLVFTVGRFGLDDNGSIRVLFRAIGDTGRLQTTVPDGANYVSAIASNGVPLRTSFAPGGGARPRRKALTVSVAGGYLSEGDTITIVFGDTSSGGAGMQMQTFVEAGFEFKVVADVCAVGQFVPIPDTPAISIQPGPPATWHAVLSSLRRPGEPFIFGVRADDIWGNPTNQAQGQFVIETTLPVTGLPDRFDYNLGQRAMTFEGLRVSEPGALRITLRDAHSGQIVARSHPMIIQDGAFGGYWADLHGQSGESIGIGTSVAYFDFARDCAFLDATSHQANDFQVNNAFWEFLNTLTARLNQDGRFVTFPGYEWSGNTAVGGDRNVYFRHEGRQIRRSSHALLVDRSDLGTDANTAAQLFQDLAGEDCVVFAHVGGRYADIEMAHDRRLETAMEIHSAWGTFEWLMHDAFRLGYRCGVVCNSDGHKGRPGASYPGASTFGAYGGLTCFLATDLTRDGLFESLRKRHHYGTTGTRMYLDVQAGFATPGRVFDQDPLACPNASSHPATSAMMGDIVQTNDRAVTLKTTATTQTPIERIDVFNGPDLIHTERGYLQGDLGTRIRVVWAGAEYRGRGRQTRWHGAAKFAGATITGFEKINAFNHERQLGLSDQNTVVFDAITTGNFGGFDVWLDGSGVLELISNHGYISLPLDQIGLDDIVFDYGGLGRQIRIFRLPDDNTTRTLSVDIRVDLKPQGDNPLWVRVTTEDGFQAWSSPIYVFNETAKGP